jgi:hypothetical protein
MGGTCCRHKRNPYMLLENPKGKEDHLGDWDTDEDNIKMYVILMGCGNVDWINVAQDRILWQALVNTEMDNGFHKRQRFSWLNEPLSASREGLRIILWASGWQDLVKLFIYFWSPVQNNTQWILHDRAQLWILAVLQTAARDANSLPFSHTTTLWR